MYLQLDILYEVSLYLSTHDILSFSFASQYFYRNILNNKSIMLIQFII